MKSWRKATRACSTVAYQAITASKLAVLRTTWANFCGEIRCDDAGRVRGAVVTVLIASSICGGPRRNCIPELGTVAAPWPRRQGLSAPARDVARAAAESKGAAETLTPFWHVTRHTRGAGPPS